MTFSTAPGPGPVGLDMPCIRLTIDLTECSCIPAMILSLMAAHQSSPSQHDDNAKMAPVAGRREGARRGGEERNGRG